MESGVASVLGGNPDLATGVAGVFASLTPELLESCRPSGGSPAAGAGEGATSSAGGAAGGAEATLGAISSHEQGNDDDGEEVGSISTATAGGSAVVAGAGPDGDADADENGDGDDDGEAQYGCILVVGALWAINIDRCGWLAATLAKLEALISCWLPLLRRASYPPFCAVQPRRPAARQGGDL